MSNESVISLEAVKEQLRADGYTGLYFDGECACELDDLAPCGECQHEEGEPYINGCDGGYKHQDPTRSDFWVISFHKEPPTQEQFDRSYKEC